MWENWGESKKSMESGVQVVGLRQLFCFSPQFARGQNAEKVLRSYGREHLLGRLVINRKFTFMILSPVLRIPSWPAGPFSEILEIKIPCKKQQKNIVLRTATRVSTPPPPRRRGEEITYKYNEDTRRPFQGLMFCFRIGTS